MYIQKHKKIYAIFMVMVILATLFLGAFSVSAKGESYVEITGSIVSGYIVTGSGFTVSPATTTSDSYSFFSIGVNPGITYRVKCTLMSSDYSKSIFFATPTSANVSPIDINTVGSYVSYLDGYYYITAPSGSSTLYINIKSDTTVNIWEEYPCQHGSIVWYYSNAGDDGHSQYYVCTECDYESTHVKMPHKMSGGKCEFYTYVYTAGHTHTFTSTYFPNGNDTHNIFDVCTCGYSVLTSLNNTCYYIDNICVFCNYSKPLYYDGSIVNWLGNVNNRSYKQKRVGDIGYYNYNDSTDGNGKVTINGWCYLDNGVNRYYGIVVDEFGNETVIESTSSTIRNLTSAHTTSITSSGISTVGDYIKNGVFELTFDLSAFYGDTVDLLVRAETGVGFPATVFAIRGITVTSDCSHTDKTQYAVDNGDGLTHDLYYLCNSCGKRWSYSSKNSHVFISSNECSVCPFVKSTVDTETTIPPNNDNEESTIVPPNFNNPEYSGDYKDGYLDGYKQGVIDSQLGIFDNAITTYKFFFSNPTSSFPSPNVGQWNNNSIDSVSLGQMFQYWFLNPEAVGKEIIQMSFSVKLEKSFAWQNDIIYLDGNEFYGTPIIPKVYVYSGNVSYEAVITPRASDVGGGYAINLQANPDILVDRIDLDFSSLDSSAFNLTFLEYGITLKSAASIQAVQYESYLQGFIDGEKEGYSNGYSKGESAGYQNGVNKMDYEKNVSYEQGYQNGLEEGTNGKNSLYDLVTGCYDGISKIFFGFANFDILGVNIAGFLFSILSLVIVFWIIKRLI